MNIKKFLIVDDEEGIRYLLSRLFQKEGLADSRIVLAVDGQDAWEKFSEDPTSFQVIITDVDMPRMNGLELIQKVLGRFLGVKIIYSSGRPVPSVEGAIFLPKPYQFKQLWDEIKDCV